jgi:hypothetical protein
MTTDYTRDFADRRAIIVPAPTSPARQLALFELPDTEARAAAPHRRLQQAVVRFARATSDIVRMREQARPESAQQRRAFDAARVRLDAVRPNAARDLRAAFVRQPEKGICALKPASTAERRYPPSRHQMLPG